MRVNVAISAHNYFDWERYNAEDWSRQMETADAQIWDEELALADLAEKLGFDGLWAAEHFGTPYSMTPNPLQLLSYIAGRTERIDLGTMVMVLPWWHPVRAAHQIAFLDILLKGRKFMIGVGRGLSIREFAPLQIPREEARGRFSEGLDIIRLALTQERFSYDGHFFKIPETSVRPAPRNKDLWENAYGAFNTTSSMEVMAKAGLKPLFIGSKSMAEHGKDMAKFNHTRSVLGLAPVQPRQVAYAHCVPRADMIPQGLEYFSRFNQENVWHYFAEDRDQYKSVTGYEDYANRGAVSRDTWLSNTLTGTPDQIITQVQEAQKLTSFDELTLMFSYGGMPFDDALRSMRLFAEEVLPALHGMSTPLHPSALPEAAEVDPEWQRAVMA